MKHSAAVKYTKTKSVKFSVFIVCQACTQEGRGLGVRTQPLAGQITSKSCSFSSETELTSPNFGLKIRIFLDLHSLFKNP